MSTTLRGARHDEPEMPTGRIQLQPPPEIEQAEGASGVLMNAIPMLGSLGSIVLVATRTIEPRLPSIGMAFIRTPLAPSFCSIWGGGCSTT